ncbi:PDZ domain-containing protein [Thalassotalea litorea]|uniref:PDZ domain-containing protein n=1 Tax=Thalassotalea litorea TaxID=2020715 RepID=UPI0014859E6D|nr:PDZ domain-containing protein [Thalassotalea litorea]
MKYNKTSFSLILTLMIINIFSSFQILASDSELSPESTKHIETLRSEIISTLLAISDIENKAGKDMSDFHYTLKIPAQEHISIGLLVDTQDRKDGFNVIGVIPGSVVEQVGIKANDKIVSVNNIQVSTVENLDQMKNLWHFKANEQLTLGVSSEGNTREVTFKVPGVYLPEVKLSIVAQSHVSAAMLAQANAQFPTSNCGIISVTNTSDKNEISTVKFLKIDTTNIDVSRRFRQVAPGKHQILLGLGNRYNEALYDSEYQTIEIDVQPGIKYSLGALVEKDPKRARGGRQWQPIIWKTEAKDCVASQ